MNKIPVYLCIVILLGQVMLFSSNNDMSNLSNDVELGIDETFSTSGRNGTDSGWIFQTTSKFEVTLPLW